ncbi:MAG: methyltransferase family protein [Pyrinomonadaceae bacterium]
MTTLCLYLLAGLVAHKLVWEVLKRPRGRRPQGAREGRPSQSPVLALVKAVKIAILVGVVAQTVVSMRMDVLPITDSPFNLRVAGVLIYTAGLLIAVLGRLQLGDNWSDIETAKVLRHQGVVARGLYAYVRHPIYVGDLLLLLGLQLSLNSWLVLMVGLLAPVVLWKAVREEEMLAMSLPGYDAYRAHTKRFIPFVV